MEARKIAVFGTRHIVSGESLFDGQEPIHEEWFRGKRFRWFSTGKLEAALAEGYLVYVVSIRPVFGPQDRWWQALVGGERVLNSAGLFGAITSGDPMAGVFAPWRRLYDTLGIPWDDSFADFDDPAIALSSRYGIRDGSTFIGHQLLC